MRNLQAAKHKSAAYWHIKHKTNITLFWSESNRMTHCDSLMTQEEQLGIIKYPHLGIQRRDAQSKHRGSHTALLCLIPRSSE